MGADIRRTDRAGSARTIGLVLDDVFLEHRAPAGHPERGARLTAIADALGEALVGRMRRLPPRPATRDELERVHSATYLDALAATVPGRSGHLDADTWFSPRSWEVAQLAAGASIDAALAVLAGELDGACLFVRPPGHHALRDRAMGFCLLNNVAVAAAAARAAGARRVAVVDWDVHHGNGTQELFYEDASVLYASSHEWPLYPGTGAAAELGAGPGRGRTVNAPLPAGAGDAELAFVVEELFAPALRAHRPDLILISAGFDAHRADPLASLAVTEAGFAAAAARLRALAWELCGRGPVLLLEGGYELDALGASVRAVVEVLLGGPAPAAAAASEASPEVRATVLATRRRLEACW